jgi:hypothetical protein
MLVDNFIRTAKRTLSELVRIADNVLGCFLHHGLIVLPENLLGRIKLVAGFDGVT